MNVRALGIALLLAPALACATGSGNTVAPDGSWEVAGNITFELDNRPGCGGAAGASPTSQCSRETYTGALQGTGDTSVQRFRPIDANGLVYIAENEVIHLPDGDLHSEVNAVFHSRSPDHEYVSMHTIVGGTGRYEGASGYLQLRGNGGTDAPAEYVGVIRLR